MLKRKLQQRLEAIEAAQINKSQRFCVENEILPLGPKEIYKETQFWERFLQIENDLNLELDEIGKPCGINIMYNPLIYAQNLHISYLKRFLNGPKRVVFIGMNPGPNGMGQTGIPFGNIGTVRDMMNICGEVLQPETIHPKRPVTGMQCKIEEPSGVRLWTLFHKLAGSSIDTFMKQCFVHNFCPLAFFDAQGKNITPSELKGKHKILIRDACLAALDKQLDLLCPEIIVAVGDYVFTALKKSKYYERKRILRLPHPSPRSLNNQNWPEKAKKFLLENDLIKYVQGCA